MRLPISAAGPVIGPITPTLMVPVPLAALLPPELELELPPQAASADNAVTAAAAVRYLARGRADNGRAAAGAGTRLGADVVLGAGAELGADVGLGADAGLGAGARWSAGVGSSNCLSLIV